MALAAGTRLTAGRLHTMTNVAVKMRSDTAQTLTSGSVVPLEFDVVEYDTDGMADTANNRVVIQTAGIYTCKAGVRLNPADGARVQIRISVNGATGSVVLDDRPASSGSGGYTTSVDMQLAVGDVVDASAFQDGITVDTSPASGMPYLSVARIAGDVA